MYDDSDERREHAHEPPRTTRHEVHRSGPYLGIDGAAGVEYGDGTTEWLLDALRRTPRDSWRPERDSWHAVRRSWDTEAEDGR
jgi:hypothetical protein